MRHLRAKAIRKALRQFHFLCGLKAPYRVLLDGNFVALCVQMKVDLRERLPKVLQVKPGECELLVPRAALRELELLGEPMRAAFELAQQFTVVEHDDLGDEQDVTKVIAHLIGDRNERKLVVCTQEVELRKALRAVPGVPLIYLNRSVLVFEDISRATLAIVRQQDKAKMSKLDENEKRKLDAVAGAEDEDELELPRAKKRRAKAPNPLSVKKPLKKKVRAKKKKGEQ
jgi:U3 small nucleolar RNA-associated protein 23